MQYHPTMEHIFVTSDAKGRVCLRDARMTFGCAGKKSNAGIVLTVCLRLFLSWYFPFEFIILSIILKLRGIHILLCVTQKLVASFLTAKVGFLCFVKPSVLS